MRVPTLRHTGHRSALPSSAILETCLDVTDLSRSRDFYTSLFGYAVARSDDRFCALKVGRHQLLILFVRGSDSGGTRLPFGVIPAHGTTGQSHVGFGVSHESLPTWENVLQTRGIPIESSLKWPSGGRSIYFRDPDGHLLELLTPDVWSNYQGLHGLLRQLGKPILRI
jgi:catechol 2,3-dioxygenase-like lactoylglutathione lyase family enzyme